MTAPNEEKLPDLATRSDQFRNEILIPSGGWLADLIPALSALSGLYDIFLLAILFVVAWVVLRTSDGVIALILGRVFDLTIPLQYYMSPDAFPAQEPYLNSYWPLFAIATLGEFACFLLVHPGLFTLVTCLKTTLLTAAWLGKKDGERVISHVSGRIPHLKSGSDTRAPTTINPEWDKRLKAAGYTPQAVRDKMQQRLRDYNDKDKAEKKIKEWERLSPEDKKKVMKQYGDRAAGTSTPKPEAGRTGKGGKEAGSNAGGAVTPTSGTTPTSAGTTPSTGDMTPSTPDAAPFTGGTNPSISRADEPENSNQYHLPSGRVTENRDPRRHEHGAHGLHGNLYDERLRREMRSAHPYHG